MTTTAAGACHDTFRRLPFAPLDALAPGRALILAPHADDESLGCGGLIAALCAADRPPRVAILTDGSRSHPGSAAYPPARLTALREAEARDAVALLGLPPGELAFLRLPDTAAPAAGPALEDAAARLAVLGAGCTAVFTTWEQDPHCDHEAAFRIGRRAASLLGATLWAYPVWGWTLPPDAPLPVSPPAGLRLDVAAHLPAKHRAIAAHRSQHGGLITDDPNGFTLPRALLAPFEQPWEVFLRP